MSQVRGRDTAKTSAKPDKPRLLVYIEQTKLPAGMAMRLMRIQGIHEYKYEDKSDFYSKLLSASVISSCS